MNKHHDLHRFNSYSAIWFDEKCYGLVVTKSVNGEEIYRRGTKVVYETDLEVVFACSGELSEKKIKSEVARLGSVYRNILSLNCNNSLMVNTVKNQLVRCSYEAFDNSIEAITKAKTLLNDKRIIIPQEYKQDYQQELDVYHPIENQLPLISGLLMCVLQVKDFL